MEIVIGIVLGLVAGAIAGWLAGRKWRGESIEKIELRHQSEIQQLEGHCREEKQQMEEHHQYALQQLESHHREEMALVREQNFRSLEEVKTSSREQLDSLKEYHREQTELMNSRFEETIARMREEVTNLTSQILEQRQQEFSVQSQQHISQIMEPLQRNITEMRQTVQDNTQKHTEYSGQLKVSVENVLRQSEAARQSAERLATALSGSVNTQGSWGETILNELLENTGLKEGVHFETQSFLKDESGNYIIGTDGKKLQPDVIVHLDKDHSVVIDSKVSLTAFFKYMEAEDEVSRKGYLKEHIASLKQQVNKLATKDYSHYQTNSIGYVIMFVPVTQALYVATSEDHSLWRDAMAQGVYIADEQTLYAALKIIALNWKQQAQAENHEKVYALANEMLDRVGQFVSKFEDIGKCLENAQKAYDAGFKKLTEGGQSIPTTCRKLIKLGAKYDSKKNKGALSRQIEQKIDETDD